ncbi:glycosyltransferase [Prauserella muralis]|uniref:Glycosyl transferase family 1 n=1 Tax=Prauserella muralis TaxID=588067 RepID=A0A2V4AGH3_9PSEU|nr:glycosyltransferase [Prauserella muralis]PXY19024.1 glycosyl transferase family 1 [Prauserella muralis]TWE28917.1 trehalose synthase (ADP-glucose) [Prauserella muralis]
MLQTVDVGELSAAAYRSVVPDEIMDPLLDVARRLRGARVLHLSATPYGGGVSELLRSAVPLYNDLGIAATWRIISGTPPFFSVTKKLHNALQGASTPITAEERALYEQTARQNAAELAAEDDFARYDFVFVHDPQPIAIPSFLDAGDASWIWRCHIDTAEPNPQVWDYLRPFLAPYDATVFTMAQFAPPDLEAGRVDIMPPAIDPLSPKNMSLDDRTAQAVLNWIGIEPHRPLVTQVSRFDPWKDPLGVIEAYRMVRPSVPGLQLAMVGSMALDDPEAWDIYRAISVATKDEEDIHLFTNLTGVGNVEVNAFQRMSSVMVQKSIREGFGLVVSEALWKGTPIVAGRAGGIPLQVADGQGGVLVDSVAGCAEALAALLADPARAAGLAASGHERVRRHFLLPRLLLDELVLLEGLARGETAATVRARAGSHDPVCGMTTFDGDPELELDQPGGGYRFCSRQCRDAFLHARTPAAAR